MATNPFNADLDTPQILNKVYNPTDDTLRVDATISAVIGDVEIDASTSSVAIEGRVSGNLAEVTPAGSLKVDLEQVGGTAISLGQKTSALSIPVVLASDQSPISVYVSDFPATVTVVQPLGSNLHVDIDNFPAIQPVSGTVSVTQGTSPWVDNITQFGSNPVVTGTGASGLGIPRVTVSNDSNILATQSGTWNINNISGTISLPTGAATSANQTTANTTLSTIATNTTNAGTPTVSGTVTAKLAAPPAGTVTQSARSIGTTAVRATVSGAAPSATRTVLAITADKASTALFYIGSSTVTNTGATAGIQFDSSQPVVFSNDAADYWIISDTAAQTVYFLEQA